MSLKTAVVIGASGLIGDSVTKELLNDPDFLKVRILVRKPIKLHHDKLEIVVTDFNNLADFAVKMGTGDCLFCCVGTTQKKVKGDKTAYRKVDYDIPVQAARIAIANNFTQYLLVSAVGADARSSNFYLKLKGEVERDIAALPFYSIHFFQPSILLGQRKEFRLGEKIGQGIMQIFSFLMIGSFRKFKPIQAADIASSMIAAAKQNIQGVYNYTYDDILKNIR